MANLQNARRNLQTTMLALVVLDIAALLFLFTPYGRTRKSAEMRYEATRQKLRSTLEEVAPMRGMDKKLLEAQGEIAAFYKDRLPSEGSAITSELGKVASANNVRIWQGRYDTEESDIQGIRRVHISALLDGNYLQAVKFINALERDSMFFIVDSITLGEEQGGSVRLNLGLETYLKGES